MFLSEVLGRPLTAREIDINFRLIRFAAEINHTGHSQGHTLRIIDALLNAEEPVENTPHIVGSTKIAQHVIVGYSITRTRGMAISISYPSSNGIPLAFHVFDKDYNYIGELLSQSFSFGNSPHSRDFDNFIDTIQLSNLDIAYLVIHLPGSIWNTMAKPPAKEDISYTITYFND